MERSPSRRVITISFDFAGKAIHDRQLMEDKSKRNPDLADASTLVIAWSRRRETIEISPRITVESLRAFLGAFRPIYDMFSIVAAPWIAWRRGEKPQVISVSEFPLVWAAAAMRLVVGGEVQLRLVTLPTEYANAWGGATHRLYYSLHEILTRRMVDRFFVINETTRNYVKRLGVSDDRIEMHAPDTIVRDLSLIKKAERGTVRQRYGIPGDVPIVLSIGRLVDDKNFSELLRAFAAAHTKAKLIIVGEGTLHDALQAQTRELGIADTVIFAGWQDRSEIWNYFADSDAFVLLSKVESLGLVFWEAMYMGVPVIGRPVGGILETIGKDGERGFLWDTEDGAAPFKEKLLQCIQKDENVRSMVARARAWVSGKTGAPPRI